MYGLNPLMSVDGTYCGNEARFINHSENPNCAVRSRFKPLVVVRCHITHSYLILAVVLVNGDHRIAVFTSTSALVSFIE